MNRIFLDYASTSPLKPEVFEAMKPYFTTHYGNPSSIHWYGRQARAAIDKARQIVAEFLNCKPEEVIFTSGGTEADNLAIRGLVNSLIGQLVNLDKTNQPVNKLTNQLPHIITSAFEHHAVLETCKHLEKQGLAEVTYIKPDREGIIKVEYVRKAIKPNTVLISIMYVNNEIGTIQPICEIAKKLIAYRISQIVNCDHKNDKPLAISHKLQQLPLLHTDAVQAVEYQEMDVQKLGVDMMSLSAHKFGGPKGVGVLYIKKGTPLAAIQTGGVQEWHKRAGTENVASIIGMAKAIELIAYRQSHIADSHKPYAISHMQKLRDFFIDEIIKKIPDVRLNGSREKRNPNNVNLSFKYIEGEAILLNLDLAGIAASSGSACTSGSLEPSHVLLSIGLSHEDAHGSVRFTLGEKTTKEEIDYTVKELVKIVGRLRRMSPFNK